MRWQPALAAVLCIVVLAPLVSLPVACVVAFVVAMTMEWRRICRKYPTDRSPGD